MSKLRIYLIRKLGAVTKEFHDREISRLGTIIERHCADENWLMRKLNLNSKELRISGYYINRIEILKKLKEK